MTAIKKGFEKVTLNSAKVLAKTQTGIDKVLWGKNAVVYSAKQSESGSVQVTGTPTGTPSRNPLDLGLFPVLDLLVSVDICNVLNYLLTQLGGQVPKKRKENATKAEKALYAVQDKALIVQQYVDQFTNAPTTLISRFTTEGTSEAVVQGQAQQQLGQTPVGSTGVQGTFTGSLSGTETQKFNLANLVQYIKATFADGTISIDGKSVFTADDEDVMASVPTISTNLNFINDFLNGLDKYTDYRNIPTDELQKITSKINTLRTVCVVIQGLDFRNPLSFAAVLPPSTVQSQAAKVQKLFKPDEIIPRVKDIDNAIKSFIKMVQQGQNVLTQGQFIIKLATLFVKIFKIIISFLKKLPIPNLYTTTGVTNTFSSVVNKLEKIVDDVIDILAQINALLGVFVSFLRYIIANSQELIVRVEAILANLLGCASLNTPVGGTGTTLNVSPTGLLSGIVDGSIPITTTTGVVAGLAQTGADLYKLNRDITAYVAKYDGKNNSNSTTFGGYTIKVIDEEITDKTVTNKRRRGVALDLNGRYVVQSDLTFATNTSIIIEEVKRKLINAGLVKPGSGTGVANGTAQSTASPIGGAGSNAGAGLSGGLSNVDSSGTAADDVIAEAKNFLDEEDILEDTPALEPDLQEDPNTEDDDAGLGLQAFLNKLKGGKKLRKKVRAAMSKQKAELAQSLAKDDPNGSMTKKLQQQAKKGSAQDEIISLKAAIGQKKEEIAALLALAPIPTPATLYLIKTKQDDIQKAEKRIKELTNSAAS